jgi:hypothetical protein
MCCAPVQSLFDEASKRDNITILAVSILSVWRQMLQNSSLLVTDPQPGSSIQCISPLEAESLLKAMHSTCAKAFSCGPNALMACCTELHHLASWMEDHIAGVQAVPGWTTDAQVSDCSASKTGQDNIPGHASPNALAATHGVATR